MPTHSLMTHSSAPASHDPSAPGGLAQTPLDAWHRHHGAKMVPFAGYDMPIHYDNGIVAEHNACRNQAALFDVSHMGRLRFDGDGAAEFLDYVLTRRVSDLRVGGVRYSMVCNSEGGVLDDVLVSHLETPSERRFHLLVVNASNRTKIIQWLTPLLADFPGVTMSDRTELTAMIAVQGPLAIETCRRLLKFDPTRLKNYQTRITDQFAKPVIVSRTGYTGEDGLELIVRAEEAKRIWENVMLAGRDLGFVAAGLGARDTLRMEAGMPLYGHELNESIDPFSVGLSFAVNLADRTFVGDEALKRIQRDGTAQVRIGLLPDGKRPAREGCDVLDAGGSKIGVVTSGGPSPTLGVPIALAMVHREHATDSEFQIDIRGRAVSARPTKLPFYQRSTS